MLVLLAAWQEGGTPNQAAQFPKTPEAVVFLHGDAIFLKKIRIVCFRKSAQPHEFASQPMPPTFVLMTSTPIRCAGMARDECRATRQK